MLRASPFPNTHVPCPACDGSGEVPNRVLKCPECEGTASVPSAEEWAVHDHEGFGPIRLGEHPSVTTIVGLAAAIEEHGEAFAVWWDNDRRDGVDTDAFQDRFKGEFDSLEAWAEDWFDQTGELEKMGSLASYFYYERWAKDCELGGDIWVADATGGGVYVFDNH